MSTKDQFPDRPATQIIDLFEALRRSLQESTLRQPRYSEAACEEECEDLNAEPATPRAHAPHRAPLSTEQIEYPGSLREQLASTKQRLFDYGDANLKLQARVTDLEAARSRCRAGDHMLIMARCEDCGISARQLAAESEARALREKIERAVAALKLHPHPLATPNGCYSCVALAVLRG